MQQPHCWPLLLWFSTLTSSSIIRSRGSKPVGLATDRATAPDGRTSRNLPLLLPPLKGRRGMEGAGRTARLGLKHASVSLEWKPLIQNMLPTCTLWFESSSLGLKSSAKNTDSIILRLLGVTYTHIH